MSSERSGQQCGGSEPHQSRKGHREPRVLLIEDDDGMREMLAEALRRKGCHVIEYATALHWLRSCLGGESGSSREADCQYDVVVSDIRMPGMSGLDVLRTIRQARSQINPPPTIFITSFGDEETHKRARELGAVTVFDKPFPVNDLVEKVRSVAATGLEGKRK